ncbi:MAG TPA: helix-turn-helix domain-containing protein [Thermodesulfovibrionales bacterium]|nr:helix-turn-helix domain-containing protein [Thermodesulfovibrionales bacterium]
MHKISSGIGDLDGLIDSLHIGDNVVWEIEAGTSEDIFASHFIDKSLAENRDVIYASFNRSPQSILLNMQTDMNPEKLTILDCFTSGKGKSDKTFLKFYETQRSGHPNIIRVNRPADISFFSETINTIQDGLTEGARYIFDSLTGMQDLWGDENSTYKFFTYMCPRLYDLGTVAYWLLEKDAHSQSFRANLRHITQVVLELYKKKEKLFLKALKLEGRSDREAFKPHPYVIEDSIISIPPAKKEKGYDIGGRIKNARIKLDMSQKDLSEKVGLTSSFISQIENNQISPSLNSFLQIANALGINPSVLLKKDRKYGEVEWLATRESVLQAPFRKERFFSVYNIFSNSNVSAYLVFLAAGSELKKHFLDRKKEEFIHVLRGRVFVGIDDTVKELAEGDSLHLPHSLPSHWANKSGEEVELLVVCV